MTGIYLLCLLVGTQLANMMTRGAQLRRRLPEHTESTSSSSVGIFIPNFPPPLKKILTISDAIDEAASNFESSSGSQQLTFIPKNLSVDMSNEKSRIRSENLRDAIPYESQSQELLDHEQLTLETYYYSDTVATDDYYQYLNVTDGNLEYPAVTDDYYQYLNVTDDYYQSPNSTDDYYDILRSKPFIDLQIRFSEILGTLRNWETSYSNRGIMEAHSEVSP